MKSYGQFCPVAKAAELFCERWTPLIIRDLAAGPLRYSELQRGVPLMSPTLLSKRLKQLEAEDIVERQTLGDGKKWVYRLTPSGEEFVPMVMALGTWGQRWSRRSLVEHEIDLGLLIWSLERNVDPRAFAADRSVVRLELTDQPPAKQFWWFLNQNAECQLCLNDPGYDVDLYLTCTLVDIIYVVRGDLSLKTALRDGRLDAHGDRQFRDGLESWLNLSELAQVPSQRTNLP